MKQTLCSISSGTEVVPGIHLMWIEAPDIAQAAQPGQFITVGCRGFILRRPLSVHQSSRSRGENRGEGEIAILFKVAGKGTLWLSQRKAGQKIDILGPLGKGFVIEPKPERLLLLAGGIGIAPLVFLMQRAWSQHQITLIHGATTAAQLYPFSSAGKKRNRLSPLPDQVRFIPVTEDGTAGQKGKATDVLPDYLDWADQVYACGPISMYKAMASILDPLPLNGNDEGGGGRQINPKPKKCQVSLEVRMGCGFGACYGCTIDTKNGPKQVCRHGPVFELGDIIWQEVRI